MGVKKDLRALHEDYIDSLRKVTEEKLQQGALIETVLSEEEGLVFTDGRRENPKKIIVINVDRETRVCYGALLINTRMNLKSGYSDENLAARRAFAPLHRPLRKGRPRRGNFCAESKSNCRHIKKSSLE